MTAISRLAAFTRGLLPAARPRAVVLVYHRVGERRLDPWRLMVDPEIFSGQMETLARDWSPLSLAELVEGFARQHLPERAIAVTFDDGYADNLEIAAPILAEHGIPATLFIATGLVDAEGPPWWDQLASLLLDTARLPSTLALSSGGDPWRIPPLDVDELPPSPNAPQPWNAAPGTRLRTFYEVWLALRALDAPTRAAALDEIVDWADAPPSSRRVMLTWEQVREVAALPGFALGAHTRTHPALPTCSRQDARTEIAAGADRIRAQTGVEVQQFAYPYGAWTPSVARLVADLGFRGAYTTAGNAISWNSSLHALPRLPAENQARGDFASMLAGVAGR